MEEIWDGPGGGWAHLSQARLTGVDEGVEDIVGEEDFERALAIECGSRLFVDEEGSVVVMEGGSSEIIIRVVSLWAMSALTSLCLGWPMVDAGSALTVDRRTQP